MTFVAAGLALGLAAGVHCLAMCGPLVAALAPRGWRAGIYHAGRGVVYVLLGAAAGEIGSVSAAAGAGRWLALAAAALLVSQAFARLLPGADIAPRWTATLVRRLHDPARRWAARHRTVGPAALGAVNGLLPCGIVYAAAVAAAGLGSPVAAVLFMTGVAIGTTPVLAAGVASMHRLSTRVPHVRRLAPAMLLAVALMVLMRGWYTPRDAAHTGLGGLPHSHRGSPQSRLPHVISTRSDLVVTSNASDRPLPEGW